MPPPPPSLVGAYYLHLPDARAIFLHIDLPCNDTCSVTGGSITHWGGGGGQILNIYINASVIRRMEKVVKDPHCLSVSHLRSVGQYIIDPAHLNITINIHHLITWNNFNNINLTSQKVYY